MPIIRNNISLFQSLWWLPVLLLGAACNTTRYVPEGRHLLVDNKLELKSDRSVTRKGELKDALEALIIQQPNTKVLGMPLKLGIYSSNDGHQYTDTGFTAPQSRIAEVPVLYDSSEAQQSAINMQNYLFNKGFFYATVQDTVRLKGKKAEAIYKAVTGTHFLVRHVYVNADDSTIKQIVDSSLSNSVLKRGIEFSVDLAQEERARITEVIRNKGYFRFTQSNIINVEVDTLNSDTVLERLNFFERVINIFALQKRTWRPTLDVKIIIRSNEDPKAYEPFSIRTVSVFPDFVDRNDATNPLLFRDTVDGINFRFHSKYIREKALLEQLYVQPGDMYAQDNYDRTINRLNALGIFNYVRLVLVEDSASSANTLRAFVLLNPADKYDFTTNFELSTGSQAIDSRAKSNFGSNISVGVIDKNWLRAANRLALQAVAGVELGYNPSFGNNFFTHFFTLTRNVGLNGSITFPRFISPLFKDRFVKSNQPTTSINMGANMLDRLIYFRSLSFNANYTYNWTTRKHHHFEYSPLMSTLFFMPMVTDTFRKILDTNTFLANSYRETFILGQGINYVFSNQGARPKQNYTYARLLLEEGGLYLSGFNALLNQGLPFYFAQYIRFDADLRRYIRSSRSSMLVSRLFTGIGIPYGSNITLPYIKQYFVGGPYSIRGWRVRQLGPGGYTDSTQDVSSAAFVDRTGDIKLEANLEYRYDMIQLFSGVIKINGAAFIDAGNIWLARSNSSFPQGEFRLGNLYKQLAMSTGLGLRLDIGGFFLLRVDLGMPVKKPYVNDKSGWVLDEINFNNKQWRRNNLIPQFAIGYPF